MNLLHLDSWSIQKQQGSKQIERKEPKYQRQTLPFPSDPCLRRGISSSKILELCYEMVLYYNISPSFSSADFLSWNQKSNKNNDMSASFHALCKIFSPSSKDKQLWNPSLQRTGNSVSLGAKPILSFYSGVYFWSTSVDHSLWPHFALQSALTKFCWWTPSLKMSYRSSGIVLHLLTGVQSLWSDQGKYKHPKMCRVNTESSVPPVLPCKPLTLFYLFM